MDVTSWRLLVYGCNWLVGHWFMIITGHRWSPVYSHWLDLKVAGSVLPSSGFLRW